MTGDSTPNPEDGRQRQSVSTKPVKYIGQISWEVEDCLEAFETQKMMQSPPMKLGKPELKFRIAMELDDEKEGMEVELETTNEAAKEKQTMNGEQTQQQRQKLGFDPAELQPGPMKDGCCTCNCVIS